LKKALAFASAFFLVAGAGFEPRLAYALHRGLCPLLALTSFAVTPELENRFRLNGENTFPHPPFRRWFKL